MKYLQILLLVICTGCFSPDDMAPAFKAECRNTSNDHIKTTLTQNQVIFDITSDRGIGRGNIELAKGQWPPKVVLHLHLKGLEGLNISSSNRNVERHELNATKHKSNSTDYYEVIVPDELLSGTTKLDLEWVDFYR